MAQEEATDLSKSRKRDLDINKILGLIEKASIAEEDLDLKVASSGKKQRKANKSMLDSAINVMSR
jgi:DNA-binding protein H-NS